MKMRFVLLGLGALIVLVVFAALFFNTDQVTAQDPIAQRLANLAQRGVKVQATPPSLPPPTLDISLLPPEKRTIEVQDRARRATALAGTRPPPANTPDWSKTVPIPTIPGNLTRRTAGAGIIVESGQAPFPAMKYLFENQWYTTIGNEYVNVWAGAVGDDPMQGVVVIAYIPLPGVKMTPQPGTEYKTPTKAGSVHIVDADGMRLKLASSKGNTFFFDVTSAKFVSP